MCEKLFHDVTHPEKQRCKNWPQTAAASSTGGKKKKSQMKHRQKRGVVGKPDSARKIRKTIKQGDLLFVSLVI